MSEHESKIPDSFPNREAEGQFFDTHDLTEFWHEGEPVKLKRTYSKPVQVRLDPETEHDLEVLAEEDSTKKSALARQYIVERIREEKARRRVS
jgi:hypothetical protein